MLDKGNLRLRLPLAGGAFNNAGGAGVFARNLNNARTNVNGSVGARPDCGFTSNPDGNKPKGTVEP